MAGMFSSADALSDENKCDIHASFSTNSNWPYDWSVLCNEGPTAIALTGAVTSLAENGDTSSATKMGDIVITDADGGTNEVVLSGTDAASFEVAGTKLFLKAGVTLDYETKSSYAVTLATGSVSVSHMLSITDLNDLPTGTVTITVPDATHDKLILYSSPIASHWLRTELYIG